MFDLRIYRRGSDIPEYFYYQAQSFVRMMWVDGDDYDIEQELAAPAMYVVLAKGKSLISHAGIVWRTLELAGETYKCYGLSGVMTFPAFRKRGLGGQVIDAAASLIREDPAADIALLWTAQHNVPFYVAHGWEAMPNLVTLAGPVSQPQIHNDEMRMMQFLSERGEQARPTFEHARLYVGQETW